MRNIQSVIVLVLSFVFVLVSAHTFSSEFDSFTLSEAAELSSLDGRKPTVCIIYTGGTIGMVHTDHGYEPQSGYLQTTIQNIPNFLHADTPDWDIIELAPLIDSSQIKPANWNTIAEAIIDNYAKYDGFVVVHGTDTMAYTASALSFMLPNLNKHVVVTGSQIPLCEAKNDGIMNLLGAIHLAGHFSHIAEVTLFFDSHLYRGNRATKVSAWSLHAFDSGSLAPLGEWGVTVKLTRDVKHSIPSTVTQAVPTKLQNGVVQIHLFPGITADFFKPLLQMKNLRGIIMDAFGTGNGPSDDVDIIRVLSTLNAHGVVIVDVTQTHQGIVNLDEYAAGNGFKAAGVISGLDLTIEAAHTKLVVLTSSYDDPAKVKAEMQKNLVGELTPVKVETIANVDY